MNVRCVLLVPCRTDRTDIARLVGTGRAAGFRMGLWVMCHHFPTLSRSIRATARFLSARDPQFWQNQRGARFEFFGFSNRGTRCWTLHRPSSFVRSHTRQERVEMVHKVLAPIKPTGGAIGVGLLVGFAGAAVCTQFLSLNMPFGGATIFQPAPEFYPVPLGAPLGTVCGRPSPHRRLGSRVRSTSTDAFERYRRDARPRHDREPRNDRDPTERPTTLISEISPLTPSFPPAHTTQARSPTP